MQYYQIKMYIAQFCIQFNCNNCTFLHIFAYNFGMTWFADGRRVASGPGLVTQQSPRSPGPEPIRHEAAGLEVSLSVTSLPVTRTRRQVQRPSALLRLACHAVLARCQHGANRPSESPPTRRPGGGDSDGGTSRAAGGPRRPGAGPAPAHCGSSRQSAGSPGRSGGLGRRGGPGRFDSGRGSHRH